MASHLNGANHGLDKRCQSHQINDKVEASISLFHPITHLLQLLSAYCGTGMASGNEEREEFYVALGLTEHLSLTSAGQYRAI